MIPNTTKTCPPDYTSWLLLLKERPMLKKKFDRLPKTIPWDTYVHSKLDNINKNQKLAAKELT